MTGRAAAESPATSERTDVADALPDFADAFPFEQFNPMQSAVLPALLDRDENAVVSAPTASGKTALAEIAICRVLQDGGTALFLAPLRALTDEREREWQRFEDLGYSVYVVTGDRELDPSRAARADVLVMTPEKADSATRKHDTARYDFVTDVDCCVIDEVHLLDSDRRGAVLEVTVARLRRLCDCRVVALSATMRNVGDVASWLDAPEETTFSFGDEHRPVPLEADVQTYSHGDNAFADKYRRLYRALDLAEPHVRDGDQALVFVASRQDAVRAAERARDELVERDVPIGARGDYDFHTDASELENDTLRQSVLDGVGFHHAGLSRADRTRVEEWFREGTIQLLFSTSTLAWGVNLPARCVVIRDTKLHDPLEGEVEMSPLDVLQMLGRAGRPGYDDQGYAWIVCDRGDADRYRQLLRDGTDIESHLADDLDAHLAAEVALGTVASIEDATDWLRTTYYYHRARSAPDRYPDASADALRDRVEEILDELAADGFLERDGDALAPTTLGELTSSFYLRLPTARRFAAACERAPLDRRAILYAVAGAAAFDSVAARSDETDAVAAVLGMDPDAVTADPERSTGDSIDGDDAGTAADGGTGAAPSADGGTAGGTDLAALTPGQRKVLAILRSATTGSVPPALRGDAWVIRQNALRLLAAFRTFADRFGHHETANRVARTAARVEHGVGADAAGLTAVAGVGPSRAESLADAGFERPGELRAATVDDLVAAGLEESVAERVRDNATDEPAATVEWNDPPASVERGERALHEVTVRSTGGAARAAIEVTVNGTEMTDKTARIGETTVPLAIFGGDADALTYRVRVCFPDRPIPPIAREHEVAVE